MTERCPTTGQICEFECSSAHCKEAHMMQVYTEECEAERKALAAIPRDHLISAPDDDMHQLHITRSADGQLAVTTNNRQMYGKWGTFGFDEAMARQMIEGLQAVLDGAARAITPSQLRFEQEEEASRLRRATSPLQASTAINYDDLFGES